MVEVATVMPTRRVGGTARDGHDSIVATLGVLLRRSNARCALPEVEVLPWRVGSRPPAAQSRSVGTRGVNPGLGAPGIDRMPVLGRKWLGDQLVCSLASGGVSGLEVTLVLCTARGELIGAAAPFTVESTWWRDVEGVVAGARDVLGVEQERARVQLRHGHQA